MRLKSMHFVNYKRFTDFRVESIPSSARVIVLAGPNGTGKSSIFDGLKTWHRANGASGVAWDESYGAKQGASPISWAEHVKVDFHEGTPSGPDELKKLIYVRTAFRNEPEFAMSGFNRLPSPLDSPRAQRMIDADTAVSENFQRLIFETIDGLWGSELPDSTPKGQIRDRLIGKVRRAMAIVFPDLLLEGVGGLGGSTDGSEGTFYFSKGTSRLFLYKNLSAGEKAAFDLLLDAVMKAPYFDASVWCIDEPETHLNTRIQATLLSTLVDLLPENSQIVLATHSIGFMRAVWEMERKAPGSVAFIDMQGHDFDAPVVITPVAATRKFWTDTLHVALGDLAKLVAPEEIVLCEGRPIGKDTRSRQSEFDASCYRQIFAGEYPNTDFISVGNSQDVRDNKLEAGLAIQTIASGTTIIRLVDRDLMSDREVEDQKKLGFRVLSKRHIECYLLDDEVLSALCRHCDQPGLVAEAVAKRDEQLTLRRAAGNDPDDWKKAAGPVSVELRKLLAITGGGSTWDAFARDTLAPLITAEMEVYRVLKSDIFGSRGEDIERAV